MAAAHRADALRALNLFLVGLRQRAGRQTRLFLLSPAPAASTERLDRLAPILLWGVGIRPGTLTSASTRRAGLVLNTDFLASVAAIFRRPLPTGATGRPIEIAATAPPSPETLRAQHDTFLVSARQQNALGGLPTVQMLLVFTGLTAILLRKFPHLVAATAIAIAALPLGMLLLPPLAPESVFGAAALLAAFVLLLAGAAYRFPARADRLFFALCALLSVAVLADLFTGSHLLRQAWMSYSIMEGARFYGIGNEYMGAVIGAALCLAGWEMRLRGWRPIACTGLFLLLLGAMGAPPFGAKVGAIPSAGIAFGVLSLVWKRGSLRARDVIVLLIAAGLLLGAFVWLDLRNAAAQQTHLARAFAGAGGDTLFGIARRKLSLEGYLLLHSPWSATLAACAFGLWWLCRPHSALLTSDDAEMQTRRAVFDGLFAGALASLLCNDSGVTAAALILLYGWAWAILEGLRGLPSSQTVGKCLPFKTSPGATSMLCSTRCVLPGSFS
jgi:hypothetical protein